MKKINKYLDRIGKWIVLLPFSAIVFFLLLSSIYGSCYVNNDEYTYFVTDRVWLHMIFIIFLFGIWMIAGKYINNKISEKQKKILWYILLAVYTIGVIVFALWVSIEPRADQKSVVDVATKMINGDYSEFRKGGYMDVYPNQVGIVYVFYWIFQIFPYGYKSICVLNGISVCAIATSMVEIGKLLFNNEKFNIKKSYITGVFTLAFFPLICYVTFIYGNLMGLALSLVGIYFVLKYFENKKMCYVVVAIITIGLSVLVKENYLIFFIGVVLFLFLDLIKKPSKKTAIFFIGSIISVVSLTNIAEFHTNKITGMEISKGVPKLAWVVMGMQEGYMACGWHNQYNENVYREQKCNAEAAEKVVKADFKECIHSMKENPGYMARFFFQKTVSQWNNPTFEGFWINDPVKREREGIKTKPLSGVFSSITGEPGNPYLKQYCNIFQTIILFGVFLWLVIEWKNIRIQQLLLATIFLGGFIFHCFWEAKSQYTLSYFVLLLPYAVCGLQKTAEQFEQVLKEKDTTVNKCKKNIGVSVVIVVIICILCSSFVGDRIISKVFGLNEEAYKEYVLSNKN